LTAVQTTGFPACLVDALYKSGTNRKIHRKKEEGLPTSKQYVNNLFKWQY